MRRKGGNNMNTKNNQRTRLTKQLFRNALTELLELKKSIEKISIKEICESAELNRSTFYAYYNEPKDLLQEIEAEITASTIEYLKKEVVENESEPKGTVLAFLRYIRDNDRQFRIFLVDNLNPDFRSAYFAQSLAFIKSISVHFPEVEAPYIYAYILNGSAAIILEWIRSGYSIPEEALSDLLFSLNANAIFNINI